MLYVTSIASGSNGNCYYVGNEQEAVLVDAGISCREIEKRMGRLGLSMEQVRAIFVSHEHIDHVRGIPVLAKKYGLPVYITPATLHHSRMVADGIDFLPLAGYLPVQLGSLGITAFPKHHDAADPHSFVVKGGGVQVGVFTDIGAPCEHLIRHFALCQAIFLEANYDEALLAQGNYPFHLKKRIRGGKGHLSNKQALALFQEFGCESLSHLILTHLSRDNNNPTLVHRLFSEHAAGTEVVVASRYAESALYKVTANGRAILPKSPAKKKNLPFQLKIAEFFPPL